MQQSLKRLSRMATAMFEMSVGRQVKRQPVLQKADLRECVEQVLHEFAPMAEGKRLTVSVDWRPEIGPLYAERGQIEQVLMNLLDNACKFTPAGGTIELRGYPYFWERRVLRAGPWQEEERRIASSHEPNAYRLDIRDSGPHIPREHLENIFEEYTSYGGGQDRSGGGLGLAICRMIITAHEGRVWAENTDHGPRFSFILPCRSTEPGGPDTRLAELTVAE
jgi:signal transduction histidine kinase